MAQAALERAEGADGAALRELLGELVAFLEPLRHLAAALDGSDVRYEAGGHPLVGRLVPELAIPRVAELLRAARPVLVDLAGRTDLGAAGAGWRDRVEVVSARSPDGPADAILIRPDGYVAWAIGASERVASVRPALTRWFGERKPVAAPA